MKSYPVYKDSGADWIGEIPEHWGMKKIKYLVRLIKDKAENNHIGNGFKIALENIESHTGKLLNNPTTMSD